MPNAESGKVVLRFAPNPSGPLSLGHARGVVINTELANMHDGEVILRFDDTDAVIKRPDPDAYAMIEDDFTWLAGRAPDRFNQNPDPDRLQELEGSRPRPRHARERLAALL